MLAKLKQSVCLFRHFPPAEVASFAKTDDTRHGQRPAAQAALVPAAIEQGFRPNPGVTAAHVESANALGTVNLVSRQADEVDAHRFDIDGHLADRLHGVAVKENAALLAKAADF